MSETSKPHQEPSPEDLLAAPRLLDKDRLFRQELDRKDEKIRNLEEQLRAAREALHRCREDYHAKVIALQKREARRRSVYYGGEPPSGLPDDWVGESNPATEPHFEYRKVFETREEMNEWLDAYSAIASNPASESAAYRAPDKGGASGEPEADSDPASERGEFHAEGLDERGIYGGRSYPANSLDYRRMGGDPNWKSVGPDMESRS